MFRRRPPLPPFPPGSLLVGGASRDWLRGTEPKDFDWAAPDPEDAARALAAALRSDVPLALTCAALALCLVVLAAVVITGVGPLVVVVWFVLVAVAWFSLIVGLVRKRAARRARR